MVQRERVAQPGACCFPRAPLSFCSWAVTHGHKGPAICTGFCRHSTPLSWLQCHAFLCSLPSKLCVCSHAWIRSGFPTQSWLICHLPVVYLFGSCTNSIILIKSLFLVEVVTTLVLQGSGANLMSRVGPKPTSLCFCHR